MRDRIGSAEAVCLAGFRVPAGKRPVKAPPFVSFLSTVGNPIRTIGNGPGHLLEIGDAPFRTIAYQ